MEDILLAVMMIFVFALGYFVSDRFGKMIGGHADPKPTAEEERVCSCTLSEDDSARADGCDVIIVKTNDPKVITCLEEAGCTIRHGSQCNIVPG